MTRKSIEVRTTDCVRYDPMDDTWRALIAQAGVAMRLFDPLLRLSRQKPPSAIDRRGDRLWPLLNREQ